MNPIEPVAVQESPFHAGEREIQQRLGVRERMEAFGRKVIRPYLPQQHQDFYQQLPFLLLGFMDSAGNPWASLLGGAPGFIQSPDALSLQMQARPLPGDPLAAALKAGAKLGLLGIELVNRRRNRLSARIRRYQQGLLDLDVVQSFGNCPQYIQARDLHWRDKHQPGPVEKFQTLSGEHRALIQASDTFFVASASSGDPAVELSASGGVDVSHRGGQPGFVKVSSDGLLTIPDFPGNNHFNTLGNFLQYPRAGLLFIDFERGDLLSLTGRAEILWDSPETAVFEGAQRFWTFRPDSGVLLRAALPFRFGHPEPSMNTHLTGDWQQAQRKRETAAYQDQWLNCEISRRVDEGGDIRSFYLQPQLPAKFTQLAGQFLTVRARIDGKNLSRTYTLSSGPADGEYRISVKRDGVFSSYLHDQLQPGQRIQARAPQGEFYFDATRNEPALLVGAGVGITPMVAMARHLVAEGVRTRHRRPVSLVAIARGQQDMAFYNELVELAQLSQGALNIVWCLTQSNGNTVPGVSHYRRPDRAFYAQLLNAAHHQVFLCGPAPFMQDTYTLLRDLGVSDPDILAESFGPAGLQRDSAYSPDLAEAATVSFMDAAGELLTEQLWQPADGSLLEFAEAHGLSPPFACRSGQCHSCRSQLVAGEVAHDAGRGLSLAQNEVLLCCARPEAQPGVVLPRVSVRLE
jgi:uncharacterized protein